MGKKTFKLPHVYIVLLMLMLFVSVLTYIVPAGQFVRVDGAIDPNNFSYIANTPVGIFDFLKSIHAGFVNSAGIIGTLLLVSGALGVLQATGCFSAGIQKLIQASKGKELYLVILFYTIFTVMGAIGYLEGLYPFYGLVVSVFMALGYDRMVGTGILLLSAAVGFTSGLINVYTVGVSQELVGLPMFSGLGYRVVGLGVFYIVAMVGLCRYCVKIKKDPNKSVLGADYAKDQPSIQFDQVEFTTGHKIILLLFLAMLVFTAYGTVKYGWSYAEICAMYFPLIFVAAIISKMSPDSVCTAFANGMAAVAAPALVIGLSRSVSLLLTQGNILDTFVKVMADTLGRNGPILSLLGVYIFVTIFNFFVTSGSGKAVMMMPILSPLGQLLGINQQVMVLTYQYADGFTNTFWPTSSAAQLSLCGVDYGSWFKFAWKIYLALIAAGFILIVVAHIIGYGPF